MTTEGGKSVGGDKAMQPDSEVLEHIKAHIKDGTIYFTLHAQQEMVNDDVTVDELLDALQNGQVIENYPQHKRGPCCLISGKTFKGRFLHVVCTTSLPELVIITVYEPMPPKWIAPDQRGER